MSAWRMYALSGIGVLAVALYGVFTADRIVQRIIAANLMGSGVFLVLVALARRAPSDPPDPVPHALVLTGIVVSVSATACALAFAKRLRQPEGARGEGQGKRDAP